MFASHNIVEAEVRQRVRQLRGKNVQTNEALLLIARSVAQVAPDATLGDVDQALRNIGKNGNLAELLSEPSAVRS
jgi:hypothetical protein